jgi:tRNA uridine 5-carbamoylmethylation protein Kti12
MLRDNIYLWTRVKMEMDLKMIMSNIVVLCDSLGYYRGSRRILRAVTHALLGNLDIDNLELFQTEYRLNIFKSLAINHDQIRNNN